MQASPNLLTRLFALLALAWLPALAIIVLGEVELRQVRAAAAHDQSLRLARDGAARISRRMEGLREAMVVLAEAPAIRDGDARACTELLLDLRRHLSDQVLLGLVDDQGWVLCSSRGLPPGTLYLGDKGFYRAAQAREGLAIGEWDLSPLLPDGSLHLGLAVPPRDGGSPRFILAALVNLTMLEDQLQELMLPEGGLVMLVDRYNRVLATINATGGAGPVRGQVVPDGVIRMLGAARAAQRDEASLTEGVVLQSTEGQRQRIWGIVPSIEGSDGGLRLAVCLEAAQLMAPVDAATHRNALLIAGAILFSVLAAWFGARRLVLQPIDELLQTVERWRIGEHALRVRDALRGSTPEIGRLALALDDMAEAAEERDRITLALRENEARLALAHDAGGLETWELDRATGAVLRTPSHDSQQGQEDQPARAQWRSYLRQVLPEDRHILYEAYRKAMAGAPSISLAFRIRDASDGEIRWLEARAALHRPRGEAGKMLGVLVDVTEHRMIEARLRLTVHELNHRVKNTLSAVQSIAAQTLRDSHDPAAAIPSTAREAFQSRLLALARSHDLLTREGWSGASLLDLVQMSLAPHGNGPDAPRRCSIKGPPLRLLPRLAVPLSIAFHELATNAARHGALSVAEGHVDVTWQVDAAPGNPKASMLRMRWQETGGPVVNGPPRQRGFGTRLLERGLSRQLNGCVRLGFPPAGAICEIEVPLPA